MNKWLKGNGVWCAACDGTGRGAARDRMEYEGGGFAQFYDRCPVCCGAKRIAAPIADVIANSVPPSEPKFHTLLSARIEYGVSARDRRGM